MVVRKHLIGLLAAGALLVFAGTATAAFPNLSDCPRGSPGVIACLDVQSIRGSLEIKGFTVPLGDSLEIRGGLIPQLTKADPRRSSRRPARTGSSRSR